MNRYLVYLSVGILAVTLYACPVGGKSAAGGGGKKGKAFDQAEAYILSENYADAARILEERYRETPSDSVKKRANIAYQLGECYKYSGNLSTAENWYQTCMEYGIVPEAKFAYADALKRNSKYYEAEELFKEYLEENPEQKHKVEIAIFGCRLAIDWMSEPSEEYDLYSPMGLNSEFSDYAPSYFRNSLVFSSHRPSSNGLKIYGRDGQHFSDIYISKLDGEGRPKEPFPLDNKLFRINTKVHEGASSFSSDSSEIFFTRCGDADDKGTDYCNIYYSKRNSDGSFNEPELLNLFQDTAQFNVGQPSLSPDGNKLYFSANVPFRGYGGQDIYVCERINGQWSLPENLGPSINSLGDESFPFAYKDDMLYFSSDGHIGMGGMDIFEAKKKGREWEKRNMQYPLNTGADDFGLTLQDSELLSESGYYVTRGFFSSSRAEGAGSDDIYGLRMKKEAYYFLNTVVLEKVFLNPSDPTSKIIDLAPVRNTKVQIYANDTLVEIGKTNESGILRYKLKPNREYKVFATKPGLLNKTEYVPPVNYDLNQSNAIIHVDVELIMDPSFEAGAFVKIDNIYYDFDAWYIRDDAAVALDSLSEILKANPQLMEVEIGSHTDSRGSYAYNEKLSQKRAESCVKYLISKGIDQSRLTAKGYGESELVNHCDDAHDCTEEQHQKNRRTTFRIIAEDFEFLSVEPDIITTDTSANTPKDVRNAQRTSTTSNILGSFNLGSQGESEEEEVEEAQVEEDGPALIEDQDSAEDIMEGLGIIEDGTSIPESDEDEDYKEGMIPDDSFDPASSINEAEEVIETDEEVPTLDDEEEIEPLQEDEELMEETDEEVPTLDDEEEIEPLQEDEELMEEGDGEEIIDTPAPTETIETEEAEGIIELEDVDGEDIIIDDPVTMEDVETAEEETTEEINNEQPEFTEINDQDAQLEAELEEAEADSIEYDEDEEEDFITLGEEFMESTVVNCEIGMKFKEGKDFILVLSNEDTLINQLVDKTLYKMYKEGDKVIYTSSGMWGDFSIVKQE